MTTSIKSIAKILQTGTQSLVCTHVSPDPDAIGSGGALCHLLSALGHQAVLYLPEGFPERFRSLLGDLPTVHELSAATYELVVAVDTASAPRLGPEHEAILAAGKPVINLDHHASNSAYGTENFIDASAAASAALVYRLFKELQVELTPLAANLLYAGLLDDTGSFRYSNTDVESFQTAAGLLEAGANPEVISNSLYFSIPERVLKLKAAAIEHLSVELDGQLALIVVTDEMLTRLGASAEETEGIVDIARSVEGVSAAVFLRETRSSWKASLRAKGADIDVNAIAARFGGGGHRAAAGCRLEGSLAEVRQALLGEFRKVLP